MKRKIRVMIALTIVLILMSIALISNVPLIKANGTTIYIRTDGSIDPSTAPIQRIGDTYTLTDNISQSDIYATMIVIERDNIVVDGAGYTVMGSGSGTGIILSGRSNVTIKNTEITTFSDGIWLKFSSNSSISGNNITANYGYGIWLNSSSNNKISGNNIANNSHGIWLHSSSNSSISGNNITNDRYGILLYFSSNSSISGNNIAANNQNGIWIDSSSNISISGNNITNNENGISFASSSNSSISGNTFINDGLSISFPYQNYSVENNTVNGRPLVYLEGVSNNTVDDAGQVILVRCENIRVGGLNLSRTDTGIILYETNNSSISGNNIANDRGGIRLFSSSNNSISGNNITANNWCGIELFSSSNISISGNNITNNENGIWLQFSSNNKIYHNNFVNNTPQVYSDWSINTFDNGFPSGGNYWNDCNGTDLYRGTCQNETGNDGLGDTPYVIDTDNKDRYPLMTNWTPLVGDVNGDGRVSLADLVFLAQAYGSRPGDPKWNPDADIDGNGVVGLNDLVILAQNYGRQSP